MLNNWRVTYEAFDCDGVFIDTECNPVSPVIGSETAGVDLSFRRAVELFDSESPAAIYVTEANEWPIVRPRWFTAYGCDDDTISLHIPSQITQSSRLRLARLIGCYGIN